MVKKYAKNYKFSAYMHIEEFGTHSKAYEETEVLYSESVYSYDMSGSVYAVSNESIYDAYTEYSDSKRFW